ncbi:MAG: aminotransferase class V-fold PLP-dependent enzyme, partial [Lysobacterales bacterium]
GALPLSVVDCGVHFLSADAHKWMLGPEGIAVFYCCEEGRQALNLSQQGWHMFEDPFHFARDDWTPTDSARRFEAGSPNSMGQAAMHASVRMLLDHGMQRVGQRVLHNTECLADAVDSLPHLRLTSRREQRRRSGILSFQSELLPAREIYRKLSSAGVACALRGDSVRLSPHFYQGEAVMEEFIGILKKL